MSGCQGLTVVSGWGGATPRPVGALPSASIWAGHRGNGGWLTLAAATELLGLRALHFAGRRQALELPTEEGRPLETAALKAQACLLPCSPL